MKSTGQKNFGVEKIGDWRAKLSTNQQIDCHYGVMAHQNCANFDVP